MKKYAKHFVVTVLGWQVRRLQRTHAPKVIAIAGSIGKTSTKFAIATVLAKQYHVRWQKGNYNDIVSVPLTFFGLEMPALFNPLAWMRVIWHIEKQLRGAYPYDLVIVELGTDRPGDIAAFKKYLQADIGVVTAITPEHMENFHTIDAVAAEELSVASFSNRLLISSDMCDPKYLRTIQHDTTYALKQDATYRLTNTFGEPDSRWSVTMPDGKQLNGTHKIIADAQLYALAAAVAIGDMLNMPEAAIVDGALGLEPVNGRMRTLAGIQGSTLLDDTYNASPEAMKSSLDTLYAWNAPQKIALLGAMNELGDYSKQAHEEIGSYCDPKQLNLVVTLGNDANRYLAEAAERAGCKVVRSESPYQAAEAISSHLKQGAIVLLKGSQNGVFAEEATRQLLADPKDAQYLVRQSPAWLRKKQKQFGV